MVKKIVTIRHPFGIHARPAAKIVELSNGFDSEIEIHKDGEAPASAKNILDIMMLAAACGTSLEIRASGKDEGEAVEKLSELMESDFGTDEM